MPTPVLVLKTMGGGSPMRAFLGAFLGAFCVGVSDGVGVPGIDFPVGTVQRDPLTPSSSKLGGLDGKGAPVTSFAGTVPLSTDADPGPAGGRTITLFTMNLWRFLLCPTLCFTW